LISAIVVLCVVWMRSVEAHSEPIQFFLNELQKHYSNKEAFQRAEKIKRTDKYYVGAENDYLKNILDITKGGTNAEAYWSFDDKKFTFQAIRGALGRTHPCDQIYNMNADGTNITQISTAQGRDTCSYFYPGGEELIFSSTRSEGPWCAPTPDMSYGYVWPVYKEMDIYRLNLRNRILTQMTKEPGYDAESTISPDGKRIIFTSARSGDLELWSMNLDGSQLRRLTYTPGYDGGAYFSYDSKKICWRANRPRGADLTNYLNLLELGIVEPTNMQIYVQTVDDGSSPIKVTNFTGVSFSPFFLPDDSGVIFASNMHDPRGGDFQLYTIKLDGSGLTRITTEGSFNSFPMFSFDGKKLAWASSRNAKSPGDIDIFVADWTGPGSLSSL